MNMIILIPRIVIRVDVPAKKQWPMIRWLKAKQMPT